MILLPFCALGTVRDMLEQDLLDQPTVEFDKWRGIPRLFRGHGRRVEMTRESGSAAQGRNASSADNVCAGLYGMDSTYSSIQRSMDRTVHTGLNIRTVHTVQHVLYCTVSPVQDVLGRRFYSASARPGTPWGCAGDCMWTHLASVEGNVRAQSRCSRNSKSRAEETSAQSRVHRYDPP